MLKGWNESKQSLDVETSTFVTKSQDSNGEKRGDKNRPQCDYSKKPWHT